MASSCLAALLFVVLAAAPHTGAAAPALQPVAQTAAQPAAAVASADQGRPLVIILDTSGSMADDDGTGTIKLAGAQAALSRVIRQQRPGTKLGLWTFPGGGSCDPGGFAFEVDEIDQRNMIGDIRALTAGGETPTGGALRTAVDMLKSQGFQGATILLVSDGLSNCDPDPCQIAQDITAEGFDLTVQAAGFQTSDEGMAELECIAAATGGQTYQANDADQLGEVIDLATVAELTVKVDGIPDSTPAGSASRVTVEVRNDSASDIENARISFNFANRTSGRQAVVPAVLPPLVRIGNLQSGTSSTHTWVVSYGSRGKTGVASYRLTAWGTNAQPVTLEGQVEVTSLDQSLSDAGDLIKDLEGQRVAILGDSYSSGEGAGSYFQGTDSVKMHLGPRVNQCHVSPKTYLFPLFKAGDVDLYACSGATSHHIKDDDWNGVREDQVPDLEDRQRDAEKPVAAGFLTVGGNDIGFSGIVKHCLLAHPTPRAYWYGVRLEWDTRCSDDWGWRAETDSLVADLPNELKPTYRQISLALNPSEAVKARGGEVAPLYVLAYPQPFPEAQWAYWCRGFDSAEVGYANDLVDDLNAQIERSVKAVRREGYRVQMITATQDTFLPDNTACPRPGSVEFMNSVDAISGGATAVWDLIAGTSVANKFMHPNALGYTAETNTILSWSVGAEDELPEGVARWQVDDEGWWSQLIPDLPTIARAVTPRLPSVGPAVLDATAGTWLTDPQDVRAGQRLDVQVRGAAPGSTVLVTLASRTRLIGRVEVGPNGTGEGTVQVPRTALPGTHHLQAIGFDSRSNPVTATQDIDVARAIPFWLLPLAALVVISLIGASLLYRRDRRTPRTAARNEPLPDHS
ncbi:VWA domain-containing protein [Nocardioides sp.]|uniref:VWA domain-containing protein n=1 Tax=Nocardioides sp. TaxID=35761 RepID=UPI003D129DCC